jgi:hypothetical protein
VGGIEISTQVPLTLSLTFIKWYTFAINVVNNNKKAWWAIIRLFLCDKELALKQ